MNSIIIGITQQLEVREYDTFENAIKNGPFVIFKRTYQSTHTTKLGNKHDIFDYELFNSEGEKKYPVINNWKIHEVSKGEFKYRDEGKRQTWGGGVNVKFADPTGNLRSRTVFGHKEMIEYLFSISSFYTWGEYLLKKENIALKEQIKLLESKITALKEKNKK